MSGLLRWVGGKFVVVLALSGVVSAASFPRERISADAKWLLHADLEAFRTSQMGGYLQTNFLNEHLRQVSSSLKFDAGALLQKFSSITAYGSGFKKQDPEASLATGVLVLQTDAQGQQIVEGTLAAQLLANTNSPLKKLQTQPYPLYAVGTDLYGAIQPNGVILLGKSRERIEHASQVLAGKLPSLKDGKQFTDFPATSDSFLFVGIAADFNELADIPPEAKVLQMAEGIRISLGEKADLLIAEVALKSKSQEVVAQIQQVLQGIMALVSLGQPENQDLAELVRNSQVTTVDQFVAVAMKFPVAKALTLVTQMGKSDADGPKASSKAGKVKTKKREKRASKPDPSPPEKEEAK